MSKIQIDIPTKEYNILKQNAKADDRSLVNYVTNLLKKIANGTINIIDQSHIPENTTIKTKTPVDPYEGLSEMEKQDKIQEEREQKFLILAQKILGDSLFQELEDDGNYKFFIYSDHSYYKYAEPVLNSDGTEKFVRNPWNMPEDKQIQYLEELK